MIKQKRAAIELSIGTVVIIVLSMSMLILGLVLVRNIFSGATSSVREIDQGVKNEINKLFSENEDRRLVVFPDSRLVELEQGSQGEGFAFSIRNTDNNLKKTFRYKVEKIGTAPGCSAGHPLTTGAAKIVAGEQGTTGELAANNIMQNPIHVRLSVSDTAPTCIFSVKVSVDEEGTAGPSASGSYDFTNVEIEITPK